MIEKFKAYQAILMLTIGITLSQLTILLREEYTVNNIYLGLVPTLFFIVATCFKLLKKGPSPKVNMATAIFFLIVGIYQVSAIVPQNFIAHLPKLLIPALFFIINNFRKEFISNKNFIFLNLIPVLIAYQLYWLSAHPFSLWVVYTFLVGSSIVRPMLRQDKAVTEQELLSFEKVTYLFLVVLIIADLSK